MNVTAHIYLHRDDENEDKVISMLEEIKSQGRSLMASAAEMKAELVKANETTNEIQADVAEILAKLAAGGMTEAEEAQALSDLKALNDRLTGVAAQYTADTP